MSPQSGSVVSRHELIDPTAPLEERVRDLLARMTVEEKAAQLTSASLRLFAATDEGLAEVAQVYFRDRVASVVRPARLLVRFEEIFLEPGEARELTFELNPPDDLAFTGIYLKRVVEPGEFELFVGSSSVDIRATATFALL